MPFFEYTAADREGKLTSGEMEAVDRLKVISYLKDQSLLVVSVKEKSTQPFGKIFSAGKVTSLDRINLSGNLSIMLKAGVSLPEAISVIAKDSKNTYFRQVLSDIRFGLENGKPLSEGLSHFPNDFNNVFVSLVKSGEASGNLQEVLKELNLQLKKDYSLVSKIRAAFAYPIVLVVGLVGVLILLMTFVLPKLVTVFQDANLKIPIMTRIIFAISRALAFKPYLTIIFFFALGMGLFFLFRNKQVRKSLNQFVFHIPVISTLLQQVELTRFARTLGNLLKSGIPIIEALEITADALTLKEYRDIVLSAKENIAKGVSLANAFRKNEKIIPGLLVSVIQVGEKTAELDEMLLNVANFYEEQVDNSLQSMASLIEPILLVIVGLAIGLVAVSIIVPIYQLMGSI